MNQREQFGGYLLLKKLSEDPLGETFRAGKIGRAGIERVVLLRVFNGRGVDSARLLGRLRTRLPLQNVLKSPNLGDGVDGGEVRGVPYVAYDYISGKNLAALLEQAERRRRPVPMDHALLITERISQALTVAFETRQAGHSGGEERTLHGFLVPQLVMLSNEGETRLLGLEASSGLREAASGPTVREAFARYLAPEALAGDPLGKADDVYSLGVLLYELLTNRRLPAPAASGYGPVIDESVIAAEGSPFPADLAALLKRTLASREQRPADVQAFHRALAKVMFDGAYNPTTFNLAFFMHNLFREDIERETQEMEAEKTVAVPVAAAPPAATRPQPPAPRFGREQTGVGPAPGGATAETGAPRRATGKPNKAVLFGGIAAAILLLAGVGYVVMMRNAPTSPPSAGTAVTSSPSAASTTDSSPLVSTAAGDATTITDPAAAGVSTVTATTPAAEDLQAQMTRLVDERLRASEEKLRKGYDEQIRVLRGQLDEARKTEPAAPAPAGAAPAPTATAPPAPTTQADDPATSPADAAAPAASEAPPAPPPSAPPVPAAAPAPTVRLGDLVSMSAGVVPPRIGSELNPRYPTLARQTRRSAAVGVRVLVDENGRPMEVQLKDAKKAGLGFDEAALDAARRASYLPATKNGVRVKMWLDLNVKFVPD